MINFREIIIIGDYFKFIFLGIIFINTKNLIERIEQMFRRATGQAVIELSDIPWRKFFNLKVNFTIY